MAHQIVNIIVPCDLSFISSFVRLIQNEIHNSIGLRFIVMPVAVHG